MNEQAPSQPRAAAAASPAGPRVFFVCTGVGLSRRGIESFFREAFDGLHGHIAAETRLFKGGGESRGAAERRVWCLPKHRMPTKLLGRLINRNGYVVEQLSFLPGLIRQIRKHRPHVIFYSDADLARWLRRLRKLIGVPFKLLYSNGAPIPPPYVEADHVQQVTPFYMAEALNAGEPAERHTMVPYGFIVPPGPPAPGESRRRDARQRLGLPQDRKIVLSVGWISAFHKRMDYVIREIASIPAARRPYLVLLGEIDEQSPPILALAKDLLGGDGGEGYRITSVPYQQTGDYYDAADAFALASLREGFGRVYVEALIHGLPCVAHDHPVMRFVLGESGTLADLSRDGELARCLGEILERPHDDDQDAARRADVRRRFSWPALAPAYEAMFQRCALDGGHDDDDHHHHIDHDDDCRGKRHVPIGGQQRMKTDGPYDSAFYASQQSGSAGSARAVVPIVLELVKPNSVIDVGCGVGTWLATFRDLGVTDILGVDGAYVKDAKKLIDDAQFLARDLAQPLDVGRRFDLAVSLEVAEHLPESAADRFVESLVKLADAVMFSAAIPNQGGTSHVNEQWQDYWVTKFAAHGYVACDCVRPRVWRNPQVEAFYAQNILVYVRESKLAELPAAVGAAAVRDGHGMASVVHPAFFNQRNDRTYWVIGDLVRAMPGALARSVRFRLKRMAGEHESPPYMIPSRY